MATRNSRATRRRQKAPRAPKTPSSPPPAPPPPPAKREPSQIEQKFFAAVERGLDLLAEDPERFIRMGEGAIAGGRDVLRFIHENPEAAKRTARNTVISFAARMTKKRLRGE